MTPRTRTEDLVVEAVGEDVLVYDLRTDDAHHLDADAARVWQACDGTTGVADIAASTGLTEEAVNTTLDGLAERALLVVPAGSTRRDTLKRSLAVAGAVAAVPVIASLKAPEAAQAATKASSGAPCLTGADCASGICAGPTGAKVCG